MSFVAGIEFKLSKNLIDSYDPGAKLSFKSDFWKITV
jgi:hypothetical protein